MYSIQIKLESRFAKRRVGVWVPARFFFTVCRFWIARVYLGSHHELVKRFERILAEERSA